MPEDGVQLDELIEELVTDPSNPPSVVGLDGYLGRSDLDGHVRLYRDLSVSYWLDIPEDAVYHAKTVDVEGKFARGSALPRRSVQRRGNDEDLASTHQATRTSLPPITERTARSRPRRLDMSRAAARQMPAVARQMPAVARQTPVGRTSARCRHPRSGSPPRRASASVPTIYNPC